MRDLARKCPRGCTDDADNALDPDTGEQLELCNGAEERSKDTCGTAGCEAFLESMIKDAETIGEDMANCYRGGDAQMSAQQQNRMKQACYPVWFVVLRPERSRGIAAHRPSHPTMSVAAAWFSQVYTDLVTRTAKKFSTSCGFAVMTGDVVRRTLC